MPWRSFLSRVFAMLAVALMLGVVAASANLITYERHQSRRGRVMVMEESGINVAELYACDKGDPCGINPSISPYASDGTAWIAFGDFDLYRIREDGTDLTMMLCYQGTDLFTDPYQLTSYSQEWSPDGTEILVQTMSHLALISADAVVTPDCTSTLDPIYSYDWHSGEPVGWNLEGMAAWNDDGSKIAFFEQGDNGYNRLVIIGEREDGSWEVQSIIHPKPALPNEFLFRIDWRRGGNLLAFDARDETGRRPTFWLMWVDSHYETSGFFLNNGSPLEGISPSWSPDGTQLIFEDAQGNLVKWTYVESTFPDGLIETLGSGKRPDWQRNTLTRCGDGSCEGSESSCNCESDCGSPSVSESVCNDGLDNDCDGYTDGFDSPDCCSDSDGDGFTASFCGGLDCDDSTSLIYPGAAEVCAGGIDDNCDGAIDCDDADCGPDDGCTVDCSLRTSRNYCKLEQSCRWDSRNRLCLNK